MNVLAVDADVAVMVVVAAVTNAAAVVVRAFAAAAIAAETAAVVAVAWQGIGCQFFADWPVPQSSL
jgi:hypothetical protein